MKTPSIDRLAASGTLYTRGYLPTAVCRPSLATLLTGRYPHQHGITGNDPAGGAKDDALEASTWSANLITPSRTHRSTCFRRLALP